MKEIAVLLFLLPLLFIVLPLLIWSLIWVYNDAEKRGKPGGLVALMVFFMNWPFSLLVWLVFRPKLGEPR